MNENDPTTPVDAPDAELPAETRRHLAELDVGEARYVFAGDLTLARRFGKGWLVLTESHLAALDDTGASAVRPLQGLKSVRVDELFGSARLVAVHGTPEPDDPAPAADEQDKKDAAPSEETILLYYTKSCVPQAARMARVASDVIRGHTLVQPEPQADHAYCPRCNAPLLERGAPCSACVPTFKILVRLLGQLRAYRPQMILLLALTLANVLTQLLPPLVTKTIVDQVIGEGALGRLPFWIGAMAGLYVLGFALQLGSGRISAWLAANLTTDLRNRMHAHAQTLRLAYFGRKESGHITARIMQDTGQILHFLVDGMPFFLVNSLLLLGIAGVLLWMNWMLALIIFIPVPLLLMRGRYFMTVLRPLFHRHGNLHGWLHTQLHESVSGIKTVKACARQEARSAAFDKTSDSMRDLEVRIEHSFLLFQRSMFLVMGLGVTACWAYGGHQAITTETFTIGTLMAFVHYIWLFYGPLQWFSMLFNWMTRAMAAAERIFAFLDEKPETHERADAKPVPRLRARVEFDRVRFSYERGQEVIKGVSFTVEPGEMIGLVGKSGVGKSTLINLLCRFWDVDEGALRVDGTDVRDYRLDDYRRQIGIVMQETFLFHDSILENLRYYKPGASFAEVVAAARAAHAHDFILAKEDGYDTVIGEGGLGLSGGEKQRAAIARAILHDPPILILDEATSSVDAETEKRIQDAIATLVKNRTTIAIAHRLSTLRNADRLVVLDDGKVAEIGTHAELLARADGIFSKLVKMQSDINKLRSEQEAWRE